MRLPFPFHPRPPLPSLLSSSFHVPRTAIALSLSSLRSCRATLVSPRFCTRGDTPLRSIAPVCATLALPLPSPSPHYHRCRRQQVDDVYRLGFAIMQLILLRITIYPLSSILSLSLLRKRKREREGNAYRNIRNKAQEHSTLT